MNVRTIPCLKDNYAYLIENTGDKMSSLNILIDAPDFKTIDEFLIKNKLSLDFIFCTHHHDDHVAGNLQLQKKYSSAIYGCADNYNPIPGVDIRLKPDESFCVGNLNVDAISVPGHTSQLLSIILKIWVCSFLETHFFRWVAEECLKELMPKCLKVCKR
jgi:hydroxyacylglutathione hydrolase